MAFLGIYWPCPKMPGGAFCGYFATVFHESHALGPKWIAGV
jgi:hypothetical protein